MVKKSISHKNKNKKIKRTTSYAPLCVIGQILEEKQLFEPIHQLVKIPQKTVIYRPTDKLLMLTFSILAGAETVYGVNHTLRVDKALFNALGYKRCADQSTIQDTLKPLTPLPKRMSLNFNKQLTAFGTQITLQLPCYNYSCKMRMRRNQQKLELQ